MDQIDDHGRDRGPVFSVNRQKMGFGGRPQFTHGGDGPSTMAGIGAARTLQDLPEQLSSFGETPALISFTGGASETLTFEQLAGRARQIAKYLQEKGVGPGEPVGILASNGPRWVTACLGVLAAGAAAAPFDVQQSEPERSQLIGVSGCRFLFSDRDIPGMSAPVHDGSLSSFSPERTLPLYDLSPLCAGEQAAAVAVAPSAAPSDVALIVHTSGTTGAPKAVPLSHSNIMSNISALAASGVAGPRERALMPLPLHHIYPLVVGLLMPLSTGASVVLPGGISGPELARALRSGGATVLIGVPRPYESLLAAIEAQVNARGELASNGGRVGSTEAKQAGGLGKVQIKPAKPPLAEILYGPSLFLGFDERQCLSQEGRDS